MLALLHVDSILHHLSTGHDVEESVLAGGFGSDRYMFRYKLLPGFPIEGASYRFVGGAGRD